MRNKQFCLLNEIRSVFFLSFFCSRKYYELKKESQEFNIPRIDCGLTCSLNCIRIRIHSYLVSFCCYLDSVD